MCAERATNLFLRVMQTVSSCLPADLTLLVSNSSVPALSLKLYNEASTTLLNFSTHRDVQPSCQVSLNTLFLDSKDWDNTILKSNLLYQKF